MISEGYFNGLSFEDITKFISESDIVNHYFGVGVVPALIKSPFRRDDKPSFSLLSVDGQHIYFHDFATGEKGNVQSLLMKLWNCSYHQMLDRLYRELSNITGGNYEIHKFTGTKGSIIYPKTSNLQIKRRDWKNYDLEYWESYGISKPWLIFGKVVPVSHLFITKEGKKFILPADKYAYAYLEYKDRKVSMKIYQPFSKTFKWMSKHDSSVWDLWMQLPKTGRDLIITSSRKDALSIWENSGIPSCSLQAESCLPKKHVVQELKKRFSRVFVLYDNDFGRETNPGRELGSKIASEFRLKQIEIPEEYKSKDSSDLAKNHGRKILKQVITSLIN